MRHMRLFIAGATGVLGRNLIPLLLQQGHIIRALVRTPQHAQRLQGSGIEIVLGDLLAENMPEQLIRFVQDCDAVLHLATAIPSEPTAPEAWHVNTQLRTTGTRLLLQAALASGTSYYVQQSIVMAYPDHSEQWIDEHMPLDISPERAALCGPVIAMESMVKAISPHQLPWCIARGGWFVGPGTQQDRQIMQLRAGQVTIPGDGRNFLSPINVADMASALSAILQAAPAAATLNIVDEPLRNGDYLDTLAERCGMAHPPRDTSQPNPPSLRCSNAAMRKMLGWRPVHDIWPTYL